MAPNKKQIKKIVKKHSLGAVDTTEEVKKKVVGEEGEDAHAEKDRPVNLGDDFEEPVEGGDDFGGPIESEDDEDDTLYGSADSEDHHYE